MTASDRTAAASRIGGFPHDNRWGWTPERLLDDDGTTANVQDGHLTRCPAGKYVPSRPADELGVLDAIETLQQCCRHVIVLAAAYDAWPLTSLVNLNRVAEELDRQDSRPDGHPAGATRYATDLLRLGASARRMPSAWATHVDEQARRADQQLTDRPPDWRHVLMAAAFRTDVPVLMHAAHVAVGTALTDTGASHAAATTVVADFGGLLMQNMVDGIRHPTLAQAIRLIVDANEVVGAAVDVDQVAEEALQRFHDVAGQIVDPAAPRDIVRVTEPYVAVIALASGDASIAELAADTPVLLPSTLTFDMSNDRSIKVLGAAPDGFDRLTGAERRDLVDCAETTMTPSSTYEWAMAIRLAADTLDIPLGHPRPDQAPGS